MVFLSRTILWWLTPKNLISAPLHSFVNSTPFCQNSLIFILRFPTLEIPLYRGCYYSSMYKVFSMCNFLESMVEMRWSTQGLHTEHSIPSQTPYELFQFGMDYEPPSTFCKVGFPFDNMWMSWKICLDVTKVSSHFSFFDSIYMALYLDSGIPEEIM